ncbi:hypothetical protein DKX38_026052 [Salix brachista]|uniref:Uncharacterized protein n=1 Tax=Salix brachista TaxID=2182728 RepID=A0A5N5JVR2_9ROSI|nr:hypothetical protein DKX38_026052 [Salix brachista]
MERLTVEDEKEKWIRGFFFCFMLRTGLMMRNVPQSGEWSTGQESRLPVYLEKKKVLSQELIKLKPFLLETAAASNLPGNFCRYISISAELNSE